MNLSSLNGANSRRLVTNLLSLGVVQLTNLLLPILTVPYLIRTIGVERFGSVAFGLSLMLYLTAFTDYGFGLSATRSVALHRTDRPALRQLYTDVTLAKLTLFVLGGFVLLGLMLTIPTLGRQWPLLVLGLTIPLGNCLTPRWLVQGLEQVRYLSVANMLGKVVTVITILTLIRSPADYWLTLLAYGLDNLTTATITTGLLVWRFGLRVVRPVWSRVLGQFRSGWFLFLNNLSVITFNSSTVLVLGFFVSETALGQYSVAERVAFLTWQLLVVLSQGIYPQLCRLAVVSHKQLVRFLRLTLGFAAPVVLGFCGLLWLKAGLIISWLSGRSDTNTVELLRLMAAHGFLVFLNIAPYQTLLAYGKQRETAHLFNWIAGLNVVALLFTAQFLGPTGAAILTLLVQATVTGSLYLLLERRFPTYSLFRK